MSEATAQPWRHVAEILANAAKAMNAETTRITLSYPDGSTATVVVRLFPPRKKRGA